jgi:hypothetical protein
MDFSDREGDRPQCRKFGGFSMVSAAVVGAASAGRLKAAADLRKQGRITDATIVSLDERYVDIPSGLSGWVTTVNVSFTDASGRLVNAEYTEHARAAGKKVGQAVQIAYDQIRPVSIAPLGSDPRVFDVFFLALVAAGLVGLAVYFALRGHAECPVLGGRR